MMGLCLSVALAVAVAVPAAFGAGAAGAGGRVRDQLIVTWKTGSTEGQRSAVLAGVGALSRTHLAAHSISRAAAANDLVGLGAATSADAALARLRSSSAVAHVEHNALLHGAGKPALPSQFSDPYLTALGGSCESRICSQWGLLGNTYTPSARFGANAVAAWARGFTGDPSVYVGVVDEGVDISHPDLEQNIFTNPYDPPDGVDNDGNGYVDDTHGWDFFSNDNSVFDGKEPFDLIDAHGTIVAGEIGALGGNGIGGSGVAPHATIIPAKFLGPEVGTDAGAIAALDYLTDLKLRHGLNIVATNNSWESRGEDDEEPLAVQAAIQRAADAGILFVTIAGNGDERGHGYDLDKTPNYPAELECHLPSGGDCMITTTAIRRGGSKPGWANYGSKTVDIGAPGVFVWSTFPFGGYEAYDGTSQAAPFVAGAVALYASAHPVASAEAIRNAIVSTAKPTRSLEGLVATNGRLDIAGAVK